MAGSPEVVLVTGASGFVASHVVIQLLEAGYRVRGTTREAKTDAIRKITNVYSAFEVVEVNDIVHGDLRSALTGVNAVIHTASPLAGSTSELLNTTIDGTMNVLKQAAEARVKKFVLTSSIGAMTDPNLQQVYQAVKLDNKSWGNVSREEATTDDHDSIWVYLASKTLAEREAWKFAEDHPEVDLITINPPFIYGPYDPHFPPPTPKGLGTNALVYALLVGSQPPPLPPWFCDVRDVATAHVLALRARSEASEAASKRYLISGGAFTWREAVEYLAASRVDALKNRLPEASALQPGPMNKLSTVDISLAADHLGLVQYRSWQECIGDTVDSILQIEKGWKASTL